MTKQSLPVPRTWVSPRAKLVYHLPQQPSDQESWGIALHEECNCHESSHTEHWNYEGSTMYSVNEAMESLRTFWHTAW